VLHQLIPAIPSYGYAGSRWPYPVIGMPAGMSNYYSWRSERSSGLLRRSISASAMWRVTRQGG